MASDDITEQIDRFMGRDDGLPLHEASGQDVEATDDLLDVIEDRDDVTIKRAPGVDSDLGNIAYKVVGKGGYEITIVGWGQRRNLEVVTSIGYGRKGDPGMVKKKAIAGVSSPLDKMPWDFDPDRDLPLDDQEAWKYAKHVRTHWIPLVEKWIDEYVAE